jgi:biopolymer transport protein ExbD
MGKEKKARSAGEMQVPMAAMIDCVFQLLIYFIVTYKDDIVEAHLAVNLPSSKPPSPDDPQKPPPVLELKVLPGQVLLQGAQRSIEEITDMLRHFAKLDPEQTVIVKTSVQARADELISVLDLCRGVGFTKLNVVTLK